METKELKNLKDNNPILYFIHLRKECKKCWLKVCVKDGCPLHSEIQKFKNYEWVT